MQLSELGRRGDKKKWPNFKMVAKEGFEPGLFRLRVRHPTAEVPRSTFCVEYEAAQNEGENN